MSPSTPNVRIHPWDAPLVPFVDRYALPERFEATVTPSEPDLPVCHLTIAVEDGRAVCEELHMQRKPGGPPIGRALVRRVPVKDYVDRAVDRAGHWTLPDTGKSPYTWIGDGQTYPLLTEPVGEDKVATPVPGLGRTEQYKATSRAPRVQVSDEMLRDVADTYRAAHLRGEPPTRAVMRQWYASRSTASRWVKRAREAGHLGPALPRVAGELSDGSS